MLVSVRVRVCVCIILTVYGHDFIESTKNKCLKIECIDANSVISFSDVRVCVQVYFMLSGIIFHVSGVSVKQNKRQTFFFAQDRSQQ